MKRFTALCALVLVCCLLWLSIGAGASDNYVVLYGFAFDVNTDGKAVIHQFDDRTADVSIPKNLLGADVAEIADYAFFGHSAINSISFENATSLSRIGENAFNGCAGLSALALPAGLDELGFGAFQNCIRLRRLSIGEGIAHIPDQCFYGCCALEEVSLPDSVETIGELAFGNCSSLDIVLIPDSVEQIQPTAFSGCSHLVIYCSSRSYAASFADDNGIPYVLTDPDEYLLGDADGDGEITILDATKIQRLLAGLVKDYGGLIALRGDCARDGIDILDATKIQRYLVGFTAVDPIGEIVSAQM